MTLAKCPVRVCREPICGATNFQRPEKVSPSGTPSLNRFFLQSWTTYRGHVGDPTTLTSKMSSPVPEISTQ